MWTLTLRTPEGRPRLFQVKSPRISVGRREDCDIVLSDTSASRSHAEITYDPRGEILKIRDLGSTNGTYVNRERLSEPHLLKHNDVIRIGADLIHVTYQVSTDPLGMRHFGTQPLTRDVLLEIDRPARRLALRGCPPPEYRPGYRDCAERGLPAHAGVDGCR